MKRLLFIPAVLGFFVLAVAQHGADEGDALLAVGDPAPDVELAGLDGRIFTLRDLRGKTVVLSFWFLRCGACCAGLPDLDRLAAEATDDVVVLAVNAGDRPDEIADHFVRRGFVLRAVRQKGLEASRAFRVRGYPTTYVIGPDGRVRWRASGWRGAELRAALAGGSSS